MKVKASKEQREGVARVFDTLAASSVIGAALGITGHGVMTVLEIGCLLVLTPILLASGWFLRGAGK